MQIVSTTASTVMIPMAMRQPTMCPMAAAPGTPSTMPSDVPPYTNEMARPVMFCGTSRAA